MFFGIVPLCETWATDYTVSEVGDWNAPTPESLAEALQLIVDGETIILGDSWVDGGWSNWPISTSGTHIVFAPSTKLADGKSITIELNDEALAGANLDIVGGLGTLFFQSTSPSKNGILGASDKNDDFGVGLSGDGRAVLIDVKLYANSLEVGKNGTIALLKLTDTSSATANSVTITGIRNELSFEDSSFLTSTGPLSITYGGILTSTSSGTIKIDGNTSINTGGSFNASGGSVIIGGNLSVEGVGVWEQTNNPGNYTTIRSEFDGSGTLIIDGDMISATQGGRIDLSGFTFDPWNVSSGKTVTVDGVFSFTDNGTSYGSELIWKGDLAVSDTGKVDVKNGGKMSKVNNITVGTDGTVTVSGMVDDSDSGEKYQSEIVSTWTAGTPTNTEMLINGGTVTVDGGGRIAGIGTGGITVGNDGNLNIEGVHTATNTISEVTTAGNLTVGSGGKGYLTIKTGGKLDAKTGTFNSESVIIVEGVGTGDKEAMLNLTGLVADDATVQIGKGALFHVDGDTVLGNAKDKTTILSIEARGGTGATDATLTTTGKLTVGNAGNVDVTINSGGNVTSGDKTILGAGSTSKVTVTIAGERYLSRAAWNAGGATEIAPGAGFAAPLGNTALDVQSGVLAVSGHLAMAGDYSFDALGNQYGVAKFGKDGKDAELRMDGAGSSFVNMNTNNFVIDNDAPANNSKGLIQINSGAYVSGSGNIYAGEKFSVGGGTIAPGTRYMYDFDHDVPHHGEPPLSHTGTDVLKSLGHLHIYDRGNVPTEFNSATYRTELDRTDKADRTTVYGDLVFNDTALVPKFTIDISRPLDGKYLLVDTSSGGTISGFIPQTLENLAPDSRLLNLNGKLLKGNVRIDYNGGMFTEWTGTGYDTNIAAPKTEVWLTVNTTSGGNVVTYWTGTDTTTSDNGVSDGKRYWNMVSKNFDAKTAIDGADKPFTGDNQFLDGDIVVFDFTKVTNPDNRKVYVTMDGTNYSGDLHDYGNVRVAEVNVLGGDGAGLNPEDPGYADVDRFFWYGDADGKGGSIYAYDSALYTTLDKGAGFSSPSGRFNKVGDGVLEIFNANEFYGGIHLGVDGTTGGRIILHNDKGLGTYNSMSGYQQKGLVTVHEDTVIELADPNMTINNRFIVEKDKVLTFTFPGDFTIAGNNALAGGAIEGGKGGGVYIGDGGQIVYEGTGKLNINNNKGSAGGGIYTKLGYTLQVPAYIKENYAQGAGGGVYAERFFQLTDGSEITGNVAQGAGGGIYVGNVGSLSGPGDSQFILHGNTTVLNNMSGGKIGGGVYVDAGRDLIIRTSWEEYVDSKGKTKIFKGGDVWFEGNYAGVGFDPDNPSTGKLDRENAIRNSIHLSRSADGGSGDPATLTVSGPYNTYFYDAVSGDVGTEISIKGVLADPTTARGPNAASDAAMILREQKGTVVFHADSAFYGDTTVSGGATFRLETYDKDENGDTIEPFEAVYGRKGSLTPDETIPDSEKDNTFTLDSTSWITGRGTIAADDIVLNGIIDLDDGRFSRPGKEENETTNPLDPAGPTLETRDGSGEIVEMTTKQGVLKLDGAVAVADTSKWYLTLTNATNAKQGLTDRIDVTGTADFGGTAGNRLTLDVDSMVRGQYTIMKTTGGITGGYNTLKLNSDAPVFYNGIDLTQKGLSEQGGIDYPYLGRVIATTYIGTGTTDENNKNHLYLDITGRNRHVQSSVTGNWGDDSSWTFTGANFDIANSKTTGTWSKADSGPTTTTYIEGDMVTLHGGTHTLTTNVNPVDLYVDGSVGTVTIGGGYGITTFSTDAVSTETAKGQDATTITTDEDDNDYEIPGYTGKLYKTTASTLAFTNTGGNIFTGGIDIGTTAGAAGGTIAFSDGNQLGVGTDKFIDFLGSGTLNATASTTLATDIHVKTGKTATFDIDTGVTLTQSGIISEAGAIVKIDLGTLLLDAKNTFIGGTTLEAGTIQIGGIAGTAAAPNTALGLYDNTRTDLLAGVVDVTGSGTITNVDTARTIRNRFLAESAGAGLAFGNAANLTIDGVNAGDAAEGGAVRVLAVADQLTFSGAGAMTFSGNQAKSGGGIYDANTSLLTVSKAITLTGNKALDGSGGGLHAAGATTFESSLALNANTATGSGGGLYSGGAVTLNGTSTKTIAGNAATTGSGGGIYGSDVTINGAFMLGGTTVANANTAGTDGGGLYSTSTVSLTGTGTKTIYGNTAGDQGGGIYVGNTGGAATAFTALGTTNFGTTSNNTGNQAGTDGGGLYVAGGASFATLNVFRNEAGTGAVGGSGGGIYATGDVIATGTVSIGDATAANGNKALDVGGGIYSGGDITFSGNNNKSIRSNTAGTSGGGLYTKTGTVTLAGTGTKNITGNTATDGSGGAIYAQNISLAGPATISGNKANTGLGGAFYVDGGLLTLGPAAAANTITFSGNTASTDGGEAVYLADDADVSITGAGNVLFNDSLVSSAFHEDGGKLHTFTKAGTGTVMFANSKNSKFYGDTTVNSGTFRVTRGTSFGGGGLVHADAKATVFTLSGANVNNIRLTGGGSLTADTFNIYGVLAPDSSTGLTVADYPSAETRGVLAFNGDVNMYGDNEKLSFQYDVNLDGVLDRDPSVQGDSDLVEINGTLNVANSNKILVNLHNYTEGLFLLIDATNLDLGAFAADGVDGINGDGAFDVLIHDFAKTARHQVSFLRGDEADVTNGTLHSDVTPHANQIWLGTRYNNLYMHWTGLDPDGGIRIWDGVDNETNANWIDVKGNAGETHFENRDTVYFGETAPNWNWNGTTVMDETVDVGTGAARTVTIDSGGVTVTNMIVDNLLAGAVSDRDADHKDIDTKAYLFIGSGGIKTDADYAGNVLTYGHGSAPQKLTKQGTGILIFDNGTTTTGNTFSGGLFMEGGTITFQNDGGNTFTGGIWIDAGTIGFDDVKQLSTGTPALGITFTGDATLQSNGAIAGPAGLAENIHLADGVTATFDTTTYNWTITGLIKETNSENDIDANIVKTGTGMLTLNNTDNKWTGTTTISGGTLQAIGVGSLGPAQDNAATPVTRTIANNATLRVDITGTNNETLSQIITGNGAFVKADTGTLTLDQVNSYIGNTSITGTGTLIAKGVAALGTDAAGKQVSSTSGGTLNLELASNETLLQLLTGTTGSGMNVTKSGAGTLTINRVNDYIGTTNIDAGKVLITNVAGLGDNATARTVTMASNTELEISLTAAGTFNKQLLGAGALTKTGAGILTLTNTNTFTGGTDLNAGTIALGNNTALGTYLYDVATPQNGQVNLNADGTTVMNTAARTIQNRFVVDDGLGTGATDGANITAENSLTVQYVDSSAANADGGAIHIGSGSKLTLTAGSATAGQDITFTNNRDQVGANDIFMDAGSSLSVTGAQNTLIGSGIRGSGTVNKTGAGITQIAAYSDFNGSTTISDGTFRVVGDAIFGGTGDGTSFTLNDEKLLAGQGTIRAKTINLNGDVSPDAEIFASGKTTVQDANKFGTLTFDGAVTLADSFVFDYNAGTTETSNGPIGRSAVTSAYTVGSGLTTGDLIEMKGGSNADSYKITDGATVHFVDTLTTGKYLIFTADKDFTLSGGATLDGIKASGVIKATGAIATQSPRGGFQFVWGTNGTVDLESQVWLDVNRNSLEMTWRNTPEDNVWVSGDGGANFTSTQIRAAAREQMFNDGDYVIFDAKTTPRTITIGNVSDTDGVIVSGMDVTADSAYTFQGKGITAYMTDTTIEGDYAVTDGSVLDPLKQQFHTTGQLRKSGSGVLTFENAANTFNGGISISGGTIAFTSADQLGDGDKGIHFIDDATLQAKTNTGMNLANGIVVTGGKTATVDTQDLTLTLSGTISQTAPDGAVTKTGAGTLNLTNTANSYSGDTTVANGTLHVVSNATGTALGENAVGTAQKVVLDNAAELELEVATSGVTATLNQQITQGIGTGGKLEKVGAGEQVLAHADNTYSGGTTVTAGTLTGWYAGHGVNDGSFGGGTITNNAALGYDMHAAGTATNLITGTGTFTKSQTGDSYDLTLDNTANDFSGNIFVTGGTNTVANRLIADDSRSLGTIADTDRTITLANAGDTLRIHENTQNNTVANLITGGGRLEKTGSFTTTISRANSFTGGAELAAGGLMLGDVAALNSYNGTGVRGQVDVTGNSNITLGVADGAYRNRFNVTGGTFNLVNAAENDNTISGVAAGTGLNGGAVSLANGTMLNVNNAGSLTFSGNSENGNTNSKNDIYMAGATLNLNGAGHAFLDGGIRGSGTISKSATSTGITQIGETSIFNGTTTISGGTFRVVNGKTFGGTGSFTLVDGVTLSGGGIVSSTGIGGNTIDGIVSPDNTVLSAVNTDVTDTTGTLTFGGNTSFGTTFRMPYDITSPYTGGTGSDLDGITAATGDLIKLRGGTSGANSYSIVSGGIIDFKASTLQTGAYHIMTADLAFHLGGNDIDDLLKAKVNGLDYTNNVRTSHEFITATGGKDIWFQVYRSSLNMVLNDIVGDILWQGGGGASDWTSKQGTDADKVHVFNDGDYVHFIGTIHDKRIEIHEDDVKVAGMGIDSSRNHTFIGTGGILSSKMLKETEGRYLGYPDDNLEKLTPDGKLLKKGTGTLTFQNTGGNLFEQGIDIKAGAVTFDRADQLGTGVNGITFDGDAADKATLQAEASAILTNNITVAPGKAGTIDPRDNSLTFDLGTVSVENGAALNLVGDGNLFFDRGIQGTSATLAKSDAGIVQIGETSNFNGTTTITDGTFRVVNGKTFGGTGSFTLSSKKTLSGKGTIKADTISIAGIVSPDGKVFTADDTTSPTGADLFATLTFEGDTTFGNTFHFLCDVDSPYTGTGSLDTLSGLTTGDLIQLTGGTYTIAKGAIIDLQTAATGSLTAGAYHIMSSTDAAIGLSGATDLNDALILYRNEKSYYSTVRNTNEFVYANGNKDVWLQVYANSLNMVWNVSDTNNTWSSTGADSHWTSKQGEVDSRLEEKEHVFNNGDYVHFTEAAGASIEIVGQVKVAGMEVDKGNYTFTGGGGILADDDLDSTEGRYVENGTLVPDGKLIKKGSGTLTFQNTGGNLFEQGIDIKAGAVTFDRADQLGTGDSGITFDGVGADKATLRAEASAMLTNNITVAAGKIGTIDPRGNSLTFNTGTVSVGAGGRLNLSVDIVDDKKGFLFFNEGVQGTGMIEKTGVGTVQIGGDSAFNGTTAVSAGTFRVAQGVSYGAAGSGTFTDAAGSTIAGGGTILADTVSISGTISADSDKLDAEKTIVAPGRRFGTLYIDAETTLQDGFRMEYDALVDSSRTPYGDLLKVVGGKTLTFGTGTINLVNAQGRLSGSYKIMEADTKIQHPLDGDPDRVLTATLNGSNLNHLSVRGTYTFYQKQDGVADPDGNQIWLDFEKNSLVMTWQGGAADDVWTTTEGGENWLSAQGKDSAPSTYGIKERVFQNGDYVHFTTLSDDKEITVVGPIVVSGFNFDADSDFAFSGTGTIVATLPTNSDGDSIEGKYLNYPDQDPEKLTPDGKLRKDGSGTLAFDNGANTFREGIEIKAGTVAFTRADQLGDGGKGILILGDAVLRSDADIAAPAALGNNLKIAGGVTATLDSNGHTFAVSGIIDEISGTGNLEKTGLGTLRLTNAANAWDGTTTIAAGTLQAVGVETLGTNAATRTVAVNSGAELELEIGGTAARETLRQKITGAGSVEKTGAKTLVLTNNNDYEGGTTIAGGKIVAETLNAVGKNAAAGTVTMKTNTALELKLETGEGGTFAQKITGSGKLVKSGDSDSTLTLSRNDNDYTGDTDIDSGRIRVTDVGAVGANVAEGTVNLNGEATSLELALTADGTFHRRIAGSGRLVKTGGTTATLTHANTFTGGTELAAGTLLLHDAQALNKTEAVAGSNRGFVFVTGNVNVSTGNGVTAVRNRFEVSPNVRLTLDPLDIVGNDVRGANGGAIELKSGASFTSSKAINLLNNRTSGSGGAVYAPTEHITVGGTGLNTIATLTGNSALDGGGVYAKNVSVVGQIGGSTVSGNTAGNAATGKGGAFYLVGGSIGNNAVSELDATFGSITLEGNTAGGISNAIHMNENVTLNIHATYDKNTAQNINLNDGITSTAGSASGNVINIDLPYWTERDPIDMRESGLYVGSVSDYYGNTNFNTGLMFLEDDSRFGTVAPDNVFTQYSNATLAGSGTVSAGNIQLGGTINAGIYTPPPREADIDTLHFMGMANIGGLVAGQTAMNIDINANFAQTADLMNITGNLQISGDSLVDFNTFSVGKYLIVQTDGGVAGYTPGDLFNGERIITDFESTVAGHSLNPNRFEITYTLENTDKDIYVNMTLHNEYLIWTGANADVPPFSDQVNYVGHDEYRNDWLNERLYNWHQEKNGVSRDARFRQGDKVAFIGSDVREKAQPDYLLRRKNIEIVTFNEDDDTNSGDSVAHVGDMIVTSGGTYRFTGRGIEASIDPFLPIEEEGAGQLYINGEATAIFANGANNFQRGIVLQNGSVAFNNPNQLGTIFVDDSYNGGITASHGITVEGNNSYGTLIANADGMTLGIVINIKQADSEIVIDTGGNNFGDAGVLGNYTLTLRHAEIDGHTDPALGTPTPVNGIYGKGRLVKISNGTLILADENFYEGGTVVENGTLAVAADNRLGKSGTGILLGNLKSGDDATGGTLRVMESFDTNRDLVLSLNGGAVEVDAGKAMTHTGLITDNNTAAGIGSLSKTGNGIFVATNPANDFQGNLDVDEGRFVAVGLKTLGADVESRILSTKDNGGVRSVLELQVSGEQTLRQQLGGDGEVLKTGDGRLNLVVDSPNFGGFLNIASGSVHLTGAFGGGDSFRFQNGTTLSGYGKLGGNGDGGVFESGSTLVPGNVVADDPNVNPTSKSIFVDGSVTFSAGSLYQVVITQHPDPSFDPDNPDRMRPVNDCLVVKDGTVAIEDGARLDVTIDYWADELIPFDFGEDTSGHFTIIDASENGAAADQNEHFELSEIELPRGIEMEHGWNGSLYQLWLLGNPTGSFTEIADSHNTREVGTALEELVVGKDPGTKDLVKILSQKEIDDETLLDVMRQMGGDLRADSLAMALKMPWRQPFNRLDRDMFPYVPDPCEPIGCRKARKHYKNEFWGEAYGRYTDTRSDGNAFSNRVSRAGTVIGVDRQICMYSLFGAALNYSEPRMTQRTGKVELEDIEIGFYNMTKVSGMYDVKSYFGYSHQRYDMQRHVYIPEGGRYDAVYESFRNKTSGDGFAMSVELLRSFRYNESLKFSPLVAVDYEYVWQKGYTESPIQGSSGMTALRHDGTNLERLMMRVGLNVKAEVRDRLDLFGRIQYATQLNRTEYARGNTYFAAATDPSAMDIHGVAAGRDYLNLGIGAEYFFKGTERATSLYVNYDADFWKRQTTHTGNLGFVHRW